MDGKSIEQKHEQQGQGSIAAFKRDLQKVRTGRASSGLVDGIVVDYYGTKTALSHMAQISAPEPRILVVQVYDGGAVLSVEKAIASAGLGLNPSREGNILRIVIPALTEETRKEIGKHLAKLAEDMRVSIRTHRREANDEIKKLEKESALTKDDAKRVMDKIQKQTDAQIAEIDKLLKQKEAEIMEV